MSSDAIVVAGKAPPRGKFPHIRRAGDLLFVSGTSSRRPDGTFAGAEVDARGEVALDIRAQTRAVIANIRDILAAEGATLADVVEITTFLVDADDFDGYNETWAEFFDYGGPARTSVIVRGLPHAHILIEMKAVAFRPRAA